jgi:hypothetical protein
MATSVPRACRAPVRVLPFSHPEDDVDAGVHPPLHTFPGEARSAGRCAGRLDRLLDRAVVVA